MFLPQFITGTMISNTAHHFNNIKHTATAQLCKTPFQQVITVCSRWSSKSRCFYRAPPTLTPHSYRNASLTTTAGCPISRAPLPDLPHSTSKKSPDCKNGSTKSFVLTALPFQAVYSV